MDGQIEDVDATAVPTETVAAATSVDGGSHPRRSLVRLACLLGLGLALAWAVVYLGAAALYPAASIDGDPGGAGILFASTTKTLLAVGSGLLIIILGLASLVAAGVAAWRAWRGGGSRRVPLALTAVGLVMLLLPTVTVATSYALDTRGIVDRVASGPGLLGGSGEGFG